MKQLLRCTEHGYTLKRACPKCGIAAYSVRPAKYSPIDKYGKYRREAKKNVNLEN